MRAEDIIAFRCHSRSSLIDTGLQRDFVFAPAESVAAASALLQIKENGSDMGDFLSREFGIDRKRETVFAQCFSHWQVACSITKMRVCFLEVNRHRIMNGALNPDVLQSRANAIALWSFDHVAMPNTFRVGNMGRQLV